MSFYRKIALLTRKKEEIEIRALHRLATLRIETNEIATAKLDLDTANRLIGAKFPKNVEMRYAQAVLTTSLLFKSKLWLEAFTTVSKTIELSKRLKPSKTRTYDSSTFALLYSMQAVSGLRSKSLNYAKALSTMNQAISIVEELRLRTLPVTVRPESSDRISRIRRNHLLLQIEGRKPNKAQIVSDSSKYRALLDQVSFNRLITFENNWLISEEAKQLRKEIVKSTASSIHNKSEKESERLSKLIEQHDQKYNLFIKERRLVTNYSRDYISQKELSELSIKTRDSVLISYGFTEENLLIFTTQSGKETKVFSVPFGELRIGKMISQFRDDLRNLRPEAKSLSKELYTYLISPLSEEIKNARHLIIVPDGTLWELPFSALVDQNDNYLIERNSISYAPSLKVLHTLLGTPAKRTQLDSLNLVAFGNPISKTKAQLPYSEIEVRDIARFFPKRKVFLNTMATEKTLKNEMSKAEVIHIASHGTTNPVSPLQSSLHLASDTGENGQLDVREILDQKTNAKLIVLSACDTSNGKIVNGEGMLSLSWAFLAAGARSVLATQWAVESKSTSENMVSFYKHLSTGKNKAEAIQAVMKERINSKPPYNHPYYWAGFVSVGDFR